MECTACSGSLAAFRVPEPVRNHAPGETAAVCTRCLALQETEDAPETSDLSAVIDGFPEGEVGATMALCVGLIVDSVTLNRVAIGECMRHVSENGTDPWLVLERLAASGAVQPDADLGRARRQLRQLLE